MREPVAQRQLAVCGLGLLDEADQRMFPLEAFECILDVFFIELKYRRKDRRVEITALDGRGPEKAAIGILERVRLALDQAADRLRERTLQRGQSPAIAHVPFC